MTRARNLVAVAALGAALVALAPSSRAAGPRLIIDRASAEPSAFGDLVRLRLLVTAVKLEGSLIPVTGADPFVLLVNGSRRRDPYLSGRYSGTSSPTAVVIVVGTSWEMRDDIEPVREAVGRLIDGLPQGSQVALMTYGESIEGGHRLGAAQTARRQVDRMQADPSPAEPQLLSAINRALSTLRRAEREHQGEPLRKIIVVLSDGKDAEPDPSNYRKLGVRAERDDVRIHSLAYSPIDNRRPLLGLGELSKRSLGTFRWIRSREGFRSQIDTLTDEIARQYVLSWFLPADQILNKRVGVQYQQLTSNDVRITQIACGGQSCSAGQVCGQGTCVSFGPGKPSAWRWLLWLGIGAGGLITILFVIGLLMRRAQAKPVVPSAMPAIAPPPSGAVPHGPSPGSAAHAASGPAPVVWVMSGPLQGQRLQLRHGFTVGSAPGCDLQLPGDGQVSPHHAAFVLDTLGNYTVVDRGSATGIMVNGVRVANARLQHGNVIRIGSAELRFLLQ